MRTVGLKLEPPKYRCPFCDNGFQTKSELDEHIKKAHKDPEKRGTK